MLEAFGPRISEIRRNTITESFELQSHENDADVDDDDDVDLDDGEVGQGFARIQEGVFLRRLYLM